MRNRWCMHAGIPRSRAGGRHSRRAVRSLRQPCIRWSALSKQVCKALISLSFEFFRIPSSIRPALVPLSGARSSAILLFSQNSAPIGGGIEASDFNLFRTNMNNLTIRRYRSTTRSRMVSMISLIVFNTGYPKSCPGHYLTPLWASMAVFRPASL